MQDSLPVLLKVMQLVFLGPVLDTASNLHVAQLFHSGGVVASWLVRSSPD